MTHHSTYTELLKMSATDLAREIQSQQSEVSKIRMGIELRKEKDTAKHRRERRQLARMKTALTQKKNEELNPGIKTSTVAASSAPKVRKNTRKSPSAS